MVLSFGLAVAKPSSGLPPDPEPLSSMARAVLIGVDLDSVMRGGLES